MLHNQQLVASVAAQTASAPKGAALLSPDEIWRFLSSCDDICNLISLEGGEGTLTTVLQAALASHDELAILGLFDMIVLLLSAVVEDPLCGNGLHAHAAKLPPQARDTLGKIEFKLAESAQMGAFVAACHYVAVSDCTSDELKSNSIAVLAEYSKINS